MKARPRRRRSLGADLELDLTLLHARETGTAVLRGAVDCGQGLAALYAATPARPIPQAPPETASVESAPIRGLTASRSPPTWPLLTQPDPHDTQPQKGQHQ